MRKIMKKSMLLVIFSFVLAFFWASLALATVEEPVAAGDSGYQDDQVIMGTCGGEVDGNEGDPDGYKEGWDTDTQPEGGFGHENWDLPWDESIILWLILSSYSPF
jgi:hypothetical protein